MKQLYDVLYAHKVAQMPEEVRRRKNLILAVSIISTAILDILSFAIKGAQVALAANMKALAFALMILYFVRQVISSSVQTFTDAQKNLFNSQSDGYITENVGHISDIVRGKVFRKKGEYSLLMTNSEVIFNLKEYIGYVWSFWRSFPIAIANSVTALLMSITILVTEFIQTGNIKLTLSFSIVLIVCIFIFAFLYKVRLNVRKKYREDHRILRKENDVLFNDVKNIEPLIKDEFLYRVRILVANLKNQRALEKKEDFKLNFLQILRTLVLAFFMVFIIIIKLHYAGGVEKLSLTVLTDIIAISTIYSNILDKVASILNNFENISNTIKDAERVKPDVDNIMEVYERENSIKILTNNVIPEITVNPFVFSYPGTISVYTLRNSVPFKLLAGKTYMVYGHTGCGKSTLMHLLIGKIQMDETPISYGDTCEQAYLSSIMHESNGRIGSNPVLQEIIFNDDVSKINCPRIIEILHGTHIYEDIMRNLGLTFENDDRILKYLNTTTIDQYSSGQRQRLTIVKLLYNLSSAHKIVIFDEATNALDDNTASSVLNFIATYCQKDMKRISMIVSHQVNLTKLFVDGSITFVSNTFPIFDIIFEE